MILGKPLHATVGRIFIRSLRGEGRPERWADPRKSYQAAAVFGMVELPAGLSGERMHEARLNDRLYLDLDPMGRALDGHARQQLGELPIGYLLTDRTFSASPILRDAMQLFVRHSMLPHADPRMRWMYVGGAIGDRSVLDAFPRDGLYDIAGNRDPTFVRGEFTGAPVDGILREPIWGPDGRWATVTSMEPSVFKGWLADDREKNSKRDPQFAEFIQRMASVAPLPDAYEIDMHVAHEAASKRVIGSMVKDERIGTLQSLAAQLAVIHADDTPSPASFDDSDADGASAPRP